MPGMRLATTARWTFRLLCLDSSTETCALSHLAKSSCSPPNAWIDSKNSVGSCAAVNPPPAAPMGPPCRRRWMPPPGPARAAASVAMNARWALIVPFLVSNSSHPSFVSDGGGGYPNRFIRDGSRRIGVDVSPPRDCFSPGALYLRGTQVVSPTISLSILSLIRPSDSKCFTVTLSVCPVACSKHRLISPRSSARVSVGALRVARISCRINERTWPRTMNACRSMQRRRAMRFDARGRSSVGEQ